MKVVIDFIIKLIIKLFPNMKYDYCYSKQEYIGQATFGLCNGCDNNECKYHYSIEKEVQDARYRNDY
jgi:hypothetical protein